MKLAEMQSRFHALVAGAQVDRSKDALDQWLAGTRQLPAHERMQIYANMYVWRLLSALRETFPKLVALLGDEAFLGLGTAYATAHPSEHYDIGRFGHALPGFLRVHPEFARRSEAADLAELEWARAEVFQEAEAAPIAREALIQRIGSDAIGARITLIPALRILRLAHDVVELFRSLEDERPAPVAPVHSIALVVWRPKHQVFHARLEEHEATALELARRSAGFGEICSAFRHAEKPVDTAFTALSSWLNEGFIASVSTTL